MTIKPSRRVVLASLFCLLFIQPVSSEELKKGEHDWLVKHPTIQQLLKLHNEERKRNGLSKLTLNTKMCLKAQDHANWMAETGYYQHSNLPYPEIIFQGPTTAASAVNGWIASPAHHSIMLTGSQVGFGYMVMNGSHYWVGVFQ